MSYRRRGARKRHVHWLPDNSAWGSTTAIAAQLVNTSSLTSTQPLINDGLTPTAGLALPEQAGLTAFARAPFLGSDIIVDAISGKFAFAINRAPSGQTAASGIWGLYCRFGIIAVPKSATSMGGVETTSPTGQHYYELDPGATGAVVQTGSLHPADAAWWWRRDFAFPAIDFTNSLQYVLSSETMTPPGGYIYIKPRKRLKPTQALVLCAHMTTLNVNGGAGTCQLIYSQSLRVAAHRDMRRD